MPIRDSAEVAAVPAATAVTRPSVVQELESFLPEHCSSGLVPDALAVPAAVAPAEPPAELFPYALDRVDAVVLDTMDGAAADGCLEFPAADGVAIVHPYQCAERSSCTSIRRENWDSLQGPLTCRHLSLESRS